MKVHSTPLIQYTETRPYSPPPPPIHHCHKRPHPYRGQQIVPNFLYKQESLFVNSATIEENPPNSASSDIDFALLLLSSEVPRMREQLMPRSTCGENAIYTNGMKTIHIAEGIPPPPLFSLSVLPPLYPVSKNNVSVNSSTHVDKKMLETKGPATEKYAADPRCNIMATISI
ncbi:hypothetical protein ACHAXS_007709 [Conticribra weissflogii]